MYSDAIYFNKDNYDYLSKHPEIERFDMPKTFYFRYLPEKSIIHWAIIKPAQGFVNVYFINEYGRVFDKLEFKKVKIARRRLRKCGFDFSTNRYCAETPREPIYILLCEGKKSAPYSKGNLFRSVQRDGKHPDKYEKAYKKSLRTWEKKRKRWHEEEIERQKQLKNRKNSIQKEKSIIGDCFWTVFKIILWIVIIRLLAGILIVW